MSSSSSASHSRKNTLGQRLFTARARARLSQEALAEALNVSARSVQRWERGQAVPQGQSRQLLCQVLQVSHKFLFESSEEEMDISSVKQPWVVPQRRNPFFTGREQTLQMLHQLLHQQNAPTRARSYALSGLGGIGKTQIAVEYAYRYFQDYFAVFWMRAETPESIMTSFLSIALLLHLPEQTEQNQQKMIIAVISWLNSHNNWLLIVDNVESVEVVKSFLPATRQGSLLFTTRLQSLGTLAHLIELERMSADEGKHLLLRRTESISPHNALGGLTSQDERAIDSLAEDLDGLPLALDQAGAYVEKTHCSWSEFLHLFHSSPIHVLSNRDAFDDHPLSVVRTFALSFERLQQNDAAAADLLIICCFLAPEIPETVLSACIPHLDLPLRSMITNPFQFNALLQELLAYSLISRSAQVKTITIHRLVQVVLKQRMSEVHQKEWSERIVRMVNQCFVLDQNRVNVEQWPWCEQVLPHALLAAGYGKRWELSCPERCSLLSNIAAYLFQRARYPEAERFYQQALSAQERILGKEHLERALTLTGLANTYQQLGQHQASIQLYHQAIVLIEERLGPNHLEIALPLQGLAFLTFEMANYQEAEAVYRRILHLREQALRPDHPDIATSFNDLAVLCDNQGRYREAEQLYQHALALREQVFGPDHLDVSESLNNLAVLYYRQAKYTQAEAYYQRALQIDEQKFGVDHPQVGVLLNNLALLYRKQGRYQEAELLHQRAFRIRTHAFGPDHPYTAFFLDNLAALSREQGRYEEAEASSLQVLRIYEQNLEPNHPVIAKPLSNLALLYGEQGRYEEGEMLAQRALAIREQRLEPEHPDIASSLHDLAELYVKQSKYIEAEPLYHRALLIRTYILGYDHPDTISLQKRLTLLYAIKAQR